jgi:hypothetical protein
MRILKTLSLSSYSAIWLSSCELKPPWFGCVNIILPMKLSDRSGCLRESMKSIRSSVTPLLLPVFAFPLFCFGLVGTSLAQRVDQGVEQGVEQRVDDSVRQAEMPLRHAAVFKKYCYDCHDASSEEAGVNLEEIPFVISRDMETAGLWSKVLNAINSGEMPPPDSEPISDDEKTDFLESLSNEMVLARKILSDNGGQITLRRLNRREYQNTIESLLGIKPDVSTLPDDQATAGFDTSGASLFFSSDQLEQYLTTAKKSLELALMARPAPKSRTIRIEPEVEYTPHYEAAAAALKDDHDRAVAWRAQSEKPPSDFGFLDAYQVKKRIQAFKTRRPQLVQYLERPETKNGVAMMLTIKEGGYTKIKLPSIGANAPGNYTVRLRAAHYPDSPERFHYLELTSGVGKGRNHLGWRKVTATLDEPEVITFPITHLPGQKMNFWVHQRSHQDRGDKNLWTIDQERNGVGTPPGVWVDWAELVGPHAENSQGENVSKQLTPKAESSFRDLRSELIFPRPQGMASKEYAREVLRRFAVRAFRGEEPSEEFLERLVGQYSASRENGENLTRSLIGPLAIILSSPNFIYMVESTGDESSSSLTETELAVRLAYFLWSEPPDEKLMSLAKDGKLSQPAILKQETSRLLADKKASRFVHGFVHQWLEMERLDMFQFNGVDFPTFDNAVRAAAREEIFATFQYLLSERLPLSTFLKSDFVVVNDLLAGYYGIPEVVGHEFRKVPVDDESLRGGLLGTAAVLAMGSDGLRSSPVERGSWVLRHLLHDPPAPAPPNVPQLSRLAGQVLPAHELQKAHQEQPQCAQCHRKIDPIGYGLENFDAAGRWRDEEVVAFGKRRANKSKSFAIKSNGRLPNGKEFEGYLGLRDAVAEHGDQFARGFGEALIAYGLGRPYGFTDEELAEGIVNHAAECNFEISEFIHALVQSKQFQSK